MNQRTPFDSKDNAMKEFEKIFKEKTGNIFSEIANFTKVDKKYNLVKLQQSNFEYTELLKNFDWDKCPKPKINRKVVHLIKGFI